ncbi:MAG: hypothetical protein K5660_04615 [Paludibacteraceae bacterium]|nr:hypothetical protein [Paludibacteraceae bacterium]
MSKGIDSVFLHYGVRYDDMALIEQACRDNDIQPDWLKDQVLKPFHEQHDEMSDEKEIKKVINRALKNLAK